MRGGFAADAAEEVDHADGSRVETDEAAVGARRVGGERLGGGDARERGAGLHVGADDGPDPGAEGVCAAPAGGARLPV